MQTIKSVLPLCIAEATKTKNKRAHVFIIIYIIGVIKFLPRPL